MLPFAPIFELRRGQIVESIHHGAAAIVDSTGRLLAWYGSPQAVVFLRSSAKPFQALPFVERGGLQTFGLTRRELALICASHDGSDMHVAAIEGIQAKVGIQESQLLCGIHLPNDRSVLEALIKSGKKPTPNRNNCSGKHSGMLAHAKMRGLPLDTYLDLKHPVQQDILISLAEMCGIAPEKIELGIDGCSAPNFAIPLYNAALGYARLCDPRDLPKPRGEACHTITAAMTAHPEMVEGPGGFDTCLMETGHGRILVKGGAEGFQAIGLMPGAVSPASPGIGIVLKVADGDISLHTLEGIAYNRVRPAVTLEILHQLDALSKEQLTSLERFGPVKPVKNHRGLIVGESRPVIKLEKAD